MKRFKTHKKISYLCTQVKMAGVLEDVRAEDFVEYFLFPKHNSISSALDEVNKKVSSYVKDYIWHKDPFFLKKVESSENNGINFFF